MIIKIIRNWSLKKIIWTKYFRVFSPFIFLLIFDWQKYNIKVPVWFITDLWSIPSIFFMFDKSRYISYILHDFLYSLIWEITNINWYLSYDQKLSDEILSIWLEKENMNKFWRFLVKIWLKIWWRFNYKKNNSEISDLKKILSKNINN